MTKRRERFHPEVLRDRAGDRTFERGAEYHRAGQVTILSLDAKRVVTRVSGSENYRTVLTGKGLAMGGECSCPAHDDSGFCKHMVAVAVAANDATAGGTPGDELPPRSRWETPADLLARVLIEEGRYDRAWALARDPGVTDDLAETLARASEASHPREALAVYARRVEVLVRIGGNPTYAGAVELIARMARLRDAAEQAAYVADIKLRHRAKRNLMKLLT